MSIVVFVVLFFVVLWILRKFKVPKTNALALVTGGVKAGKTTLAVHLAIKDYKSRVRSIKFRNFFHFKKKEEMPLLYSNIPLAVPYVPLTSDLLLRKKRFVYGSVIYICEASLVSNSMSFGDSLTNEQILLFYKLIGHETWGGACYLDTQSIADLHYGIKRSISEYFYVHHMVKSFWGIPLPFLIAYVKECRYSEDGSVVNTEEEDSETYLKKVLIPRRTWKLFDCYCYSSLTDYLDVDGETVSADNLTVTDVVSFNKYKSLYDFRKHVESVRADEETGEVISDEKKNI